MATGIYRGVDGVARKVKTPYIGVDGVARKVTSGYVGVDGVARKCYQGGPSPEADTLNGCSWANIAEVAASGRASNYWNVGDVKKIRLSTVSGLGMYWHGTTIAGDVYVYILGFDHDGAIGTIDFGLFKTDNYGNPAPGQRCFIQQDPIYGATEYGVAMSTYNDARDTLVMNVKKKGTYDSTAVGTNTGGWRDSLMRNTILGSTDVTNGDASPTAATNPTAPYCLMQTLPTDLRAVMKPMTIYTDNGSSTGASAANVTATVDYLPLLSACEVYGSQGNNGNARCNKYEYDYQSQYEYYAQGNAGIRYIAKDLNYSASSASDRAYWWLRSKYPHNTTSFCYIYDEGWVYDREAHYSYGVAPIFRV